MTSITVVAQYTTSNILEPLNDDIPRHPCRLGDSTRGRRYVSHTTQVVEVLEAADRCAVTDRRRVGALIGTFAPAVGEQLKLAGDVFLNLVQMIVVPLVFPLIVLGIARMDSAKKVGRMAAKAILYFEIVTTIILLMAVALAKLLDIGSGAPVAGADEAPSRPSSRASTSTNYSCTLSRRTSSPPSRRGTCWQ